MSADTVRVYDTWVEGKKGTIHFDVMTTDEATALKLAKEYLAGIGEAEAAVTTEECRFCHSEPLLFFSAEQQKQFREKGGFILPLPA
jgi:heterodisulfide reductase subunit B